MAPPHPPIPRTLLGNPSQRAARRRDIASNAARLRRTLSRLARTSCRRLSARTGGIEDVAYTCLQRHRGIRLEHLRHVEFAAAQRLQIVRHRRSATRLRLPDRHLAGAGRAADRARASATSDTLPSFSRARSANRNSKGRPCRRDRTDRARTSQKQTSGEGIFVARLHHAHRPAPRDIDRAIEQARGGGGRRRRVEQLNLDTLAGIEPERMRGIMARRTPRESSARA